ncbi:MAG: cadherin-like domain-containing protein, partial [Flavobacteriaceae bacterium]|nr:cadherin-like domain-containing protein [Flavobacteriaceae bacterium]
MSRNYSYKTDTKLIAVKTRLLALTFLLFFGSFGFSQTITLKTSNTLIVDSNKPCLPDFDGPHATYVSYEFCNNTGVTSSQLNATFNISGVGYSLGGNQANNQSLGILNDGECKTLYWYIIYPCEPVGEIGNITVTLEDEIGTVLGTQNDTVQIDSGISANATGILGGVNLTSGGIGQLSVFDVTYTFGTTQDNGDISFQPVGNIDFDAECFQLVGVEVLQSDFSCITVGTLDELYFQLLPGCGVSGSGNIVEARYYFLNNCVGANTNAQPYAYGLSGTQLKYTGNFDDPTSITSFPPTAAPTLNLTKTVSPTNVLSVPNTATYTISIQNTSTDPSSLDAIADDLPTPFTFNSISGTSDITATNSTSIPSLSDAGTLSFVGGVDAATYPYTEYFIPGNSTVQLIYTVDIPATATNGTYTNSATYSIGTYTSPPATADLQVGPPPTITANNDDFSGSPVDATTGGTTATVFTNDDADGTTPATDALIDDGTIAISNDGGLTGVTINTDGTITVPAGATPGTYTVEYTICLEADSSICDTATAIIEVFASPVANDDNSSTDLDTDVVIPIADNDTDPDGSLDLGSIDLDPSTPGQQTSIIIPGEGTYTSNGDGTVTFDPESGFTGTSTVTYTVDDTDGNTSNVATISVTVPLCPNGQDSDNDGLTDCEETTGIDDPSTPEDPTTFPGGPTSDPNDPCDPIGINTTDTDGDGLTDCEETTGIDDPSTPEDPTTFPGGPTSDPNDPCDPIGINTTDTDGDGLTDCEETTGIDDPSTPEDPTTFPGGPTSDPNDPCDPIGINTTDTDGDGLTDCEETTGIDDPSTP